MGQYEATKGFAAAMTARDPLARYREQFHIPRAADGSEWVYLCGHSLGLQPKRAAEHVAQEMKDWAELAVEGHFRGKHPWLGYHRLLTEQTARLVGAEPVEVVVMNSLTVNLHLMMVSFYRPTRERHKIVVERGAFPSDQYAIQSQIRFHGYDPAEALIELRPRGGETALRDADIVERIEREGEAIALVLLGGVNYSTGQAFDMAGTTRAAHAKGCAAGFDLAHAAGNLPLRLHEWGADFAVWCSYKYLNGGPGCVGGCFVHERHARAGELPRFAGWWGHDEATRFQMGPVFDAMPGAEGWQLSNAPVLSMAALRASMEVFDEAGMEALRRKSVSLTGYLEFLLEERRSPMFSILTPREAERRGAQLSIRVPQNGRAVVERLAREGVICDWREPDILRVAPAPIYNSYTDVYQFAQRFFAALEE
jgi:kynureninase